MIPNKETIGQDLKLLETMSEAFDAMSEAGRRFATTEFWNRANILDEGPGDKELMRAYLDYEPEKEQPKKSQKYAWAEFNFNYSWQHSEWQGDPIVFIHDAKTDEEAREALMNLGDFAREVSETKYVCFIPYKINGKPADAEYIKGLGWVVSTCLKYLEEHPGTREFELEGHIE